MKPDRDITDARVAKALAHPMRVRILSVLDERVASPSEIADHLDANLGVVSYHVRTLARMGFVKLVATKPRRGAVEHYYKAEERPVVTSEAWAAVPSIVKKAVVGAALSQIGDQMTAALGSGGFERSEAHLTRSPMVVDDQGWHEVATALDDLLKKFERIAAEAERRLAASDHQSEVRATAVLMLFEDAVVGRSVGATSRARGRARDAASSGAGVAGSRSRRPVR